MRGLLIGETALLPMLRSAPLQFSSGIAGSEKVLLDSTCLRDRRPEALCRKQTSSFDTAVFQCVTQSADAAKVNLREHRALSRRSAVPNLGVTCQNSSGAKHRSCSDTKSNA